MPRFGFSVTTWRQKQEAAAVISPPLNKAQKVLDSSHMNVDSSIPIVTGGASKNRYANTSSCTSINNFDSTPVHNDESEYDVVSELHGGISTNVQDGRYDEDFDDEAGALQQAFVEHGNEYSITDTSSLRRRQSSSTITSYYEQSRMPPVNSQQTSNLAMARGLSRKASSLLDIDGSISQASRKKRPSRLGLLRMFSSYRSSGTLNLDAERALVLSLDTVARPPSVTSVTPLEHMAQPIGAKAVHQKSPSLPTGSNRKESRKSFSDYAIKQQFSDPKQRLAATSQRVADLQNLYDHYEQMTFRDVFSEDKEALSDTAASMETPVSSPLPLEEALPMFQEVEENTDVDAYPQQNMRKGPMSKNISAFLGDHTNAAAILQVAATDLPSIQIIDGDCSDSISSRHTRTSKASKRTAQSFLEIDLHQTSVLSLSSDSEDDFADSRSKTSSTCVPPSSRIQTNIAQNYPDSYRPNTSRSLSLSKKKDKPRTSSCSETATQFSPAPKGRVSRSVPFLPATIYSDTSSASISTRSTKVTTRSLTRNIRSSSRDSRASVASNRTTNSVSSLVSSTRQEARTISLISARGASYDLAMSHSHATTPEASAPLLASSSADPIMRTYRSSIHDSDQGSIRSATGSFSAEPGSGLNMGAGRFMAVTRQEELLLASLRQKRLRMRESVIAEFDEENVNEKVVKQDDQSHHLLRPVHDIRRASMGAVLEPSALRPSSMSQAPASFNDFSMHFEDSSFPMPPSSSNQDSLRRNSAISLPLSPRSKPPTKQLPLTPGPRSMTTDISLNRVLLNLNLSSAAMPTTGTASNSGSGTDSGSGNTSTSSQSDDIFGCGARSHRFSDCLDSGDDDSDSIVSYESFDFGIPAEEPFIDQSGASQQKLQELHRFSSNDGHCPFSNFATTQSPSTLHVSDMRDAGMDADADEDENYIIDDVDDHSMMPYDDLIGTGARDSCDSRPADGDEQGVPRPDSPLESTVFYRKKALRISAVGGGISHMAINAGR
ncbi:MAG: hypothetical protein SEPTF4163_000971 [Sporothrix epigloea]